MSDYLISSELFSKIYKKLKLNTGYHDVYCGCFDCGIIHELEETMRERYKQIYMEKEK